MLDKEKSRKKRTYHVRLSLAMVLAGEFSSVTAIAIGVGLQMGRNGLGGHCSRLREWCNED